MQFLFYIYFIIINRHVYIIFPLWTSIQLIFCIYVYVPQYPWTLQPLVPMGTSVHTYAKLYPDIRQTVLNDQRSVSRKFEVITIISKCYYCNQYTFSIAFRIT